MFTIFWHLTISHSWFSTSKVYARNRTDTWAIQQIKAEIDKGIAYWKDSDIYYTIQLDGQDVTDWYKEQVKTLI